MLVFFAACAAPPDDIRASYVNPSVYDSYDCDQIEAEAQRISQRAAQAMGAERRKARQDAGAVAVGLVFWPALFFVQGHTTTEAEVARLKGEMEAIEKAAVQKKCEIVFRREDA